MPFADDQVRMKLVCGRTWGSVSVSVRADALRRLGLHPDQS
jgi:hypothetical protein